VRVPLAIRAPGRPAGISHSEPVSHLDVMPTLCELLDLPLPADACGASLAASLAGAAPAARPVGAQYSGNAGPGDLRRMLVHEGWKFVHAPGEGEELYELAADPLEMRNLASEPAAAERLAGLRRLAADWHRAQGDRCPW
jgi:choline-sulfatase